MRGISRRVLMVGAGIAATVAISAGTAIAATSVGAPQPSNATLYGCVSSGSRTLEHFYTTKSSWQKCPNGFGIAFNSTGPKGPAGPAGPAGAPASMKGAFYSVENYTNGGDGWATVACDPNDATRSQTFTAIGGGVEEDDPSGNTGPAGSSVIASFPGRMDWTTNSPESGRLDGWVVGLSGGDNNPLKVWALCVPNTDFGGSAPPVVVNNG